MNHIDEHTKKRRDLWLIAAILAVAGIFYGGNWLLSRRPAMLVEVRIDGQVVETLNLNKNTEITIDGYGGGTNHLVIQDSQINISQATCPDKVCIHQGNINQSGEMIVCLPNRMIAKIVGE